MTILEKYSKYKKGELTKKSGIYVITNILDNKKYIGETTTLERRLTEHVQDLISNNHVNNHLQNAVNKYGIENFKFEVIEFCDSKNTKEREHYWTVQFCTLDRCKGYNIKPTDPEKVNLRNKETSIKIYETKKKIAEKRGYWFSQEDIEKRILSKKRNGYHHSEETKRKIGLKSIGRRKRKQPLQPKPKFIRKGITFITEEGRKKISKANKGRKMSEEAIIKMRNARKGKTMSMEAREKIRKANLGKKMSETNRLKINQAIEKGVIQYDLKGNEMNRFKNIKMASTTTGANGSTIGQCCKNKRKTSGKFKWKYISNEDL